MRILQLTPRIAWPPTDGGRVVMLQLARALNRLGARIEVLSLNPRKQRVDAGAARDALAPVPFDAVGIDTSQHVRALVRSFALHAPQLVARFYSAEFAALVRERARDVDVVQIESPFLLPYARVVAPGPIVVLRSLNVEFRIWERLAAQEPHPLRRIAYRGIARSLRRYEIEQLDACDAVVPITEVDAADFRALGCTRPMFVLPGGIEPDAIRIDRTHERANAAGFLGSLDYRPNQEAALWIAEELRPRLRSDIELHIAGSRAPEWLRERLRGVAFHGEVADPVQFVSGMRVMLAPILSGGGMRIKILEAMAAGKSVVATTIGAEGMEVAHGANIVIADEAEAFASAVESLIDDATKAHAIGDAARALVASRYSTDALARGLLAFYDELAQR